MRLFTNLPKFGKASSLVLVSLLMSCGAQHKGAQDVEEVFSGESISLNAKVAQICNQLNSGGQGPSLSGLTYAQSACQSPASKAQNLKTLKQFNFSAVESSGQKFDSSNPNAQSKNATNKLTFRAELWLNQSLVGMAGKIIGALKNGTLKAAQTGGYSDEKATIKMLRDPKIDKDILRIQAAMDFQSTAKQNGAIDVHNEIYVDAMKIGNAFVASAEFKEELDAKKSLVKKLKAMVFIVPHAQDIYIDVMIDAELHSYGVGSSVEDQVVKAVREAVELNLKDLMNY